MIEQLELIEQALAYAKFRNKDIEKATKRLVKGLGKELFEVGYEPGLDVEGVTEELRDVLDDVDQGIEDINAIDTTDSSNDEEENEE